MNAAEHSIAGDWQGTYAFDDPDAARAPVPFQAAWAMQGETGRFTGPAQDNGAGGEASTDGMQSGRQVAFTKVYVDRSSSYLHPVAYEGTLSEDGTQLAGTWRVAALSGTWDARRVLSDDGSAESAQNKAE